MEKLKNYSEEFKFKFEKFLIGCDSLEEMGLWDKAAYGEMDAYYSNDLVSVIIRLIAADGVFSSREVEYLNNIFGFEYTEQELASLYEECKDGIEDILDEEMENGLSIMKAKNEKLASAYIELISLICDIITESDGEVNKAELEIARQLKEALN